MGFMDRAKKLAEQAQETLDEAGAGPHFDDHGRPVPVAGSPAPMPAPPSTESVPAPPVGSAPEPAEDSANSAPDPFRPIQ